MQGRGQRGRQREANARTPGFGRPGSRSLTRGEDDTTLCTPACPGQAAARGSHGPGPRRTRQPGGQRADAPEPAARARLAAAERIPAGSREDLERRAGAARPGAAHRGPALQRAGLGGKPGRVVRGGDVPAQRPHDAAAGRRGAGRREDPPAHPLRGAAVDRGERAEQLPRLQPGGAAQGAGDPGREPDAGHAAPAARPQARAPVADRRERLRGGPQRGHHRGQRDLREPAVPADRVQTADGQGVRAAAADRAAVHQQVLHPRPAAGQLLRAPCAGAGAAGVPGQLAQCRREPRAGRLGRVHRGRRDPGHPRRAGGGQKARS